MSINTKFVVILLCICLTGCGGGGGGNDEKDNVPLNTQNEVAPPISATQGKFATTVSISPSVPSLAAQSIISVVSGDGRSRINEPLTVTPGPSGDAILLALKQNGELLLAGPSAPAVTVLSPESTAVGLVRLAMGILPQNIDGTKANLAIKGTPRFAKLVKQISVALATAQSLSGDAVMEQVGAVTRETINVLRSSSTMANRMNQFASQVDLEVEPPLPLTILRDQRVHGIHLTAYRNNVLDVSNTMQIVWEVTSTSAPGEKIRLPAASILRAYAGATPFWASVEATRIPGNNGKGFDISLQQTEATQRENLFEIFRSTLDILLPMAPSLSQQCKTKVLSAMISPDELSAALADPTSSNIEQYIKNYTTVKGASSIVITIAECANLPISEAAEAYVKAVLGLLWTGYKTIATIDQVGGIYATMYQTFAYWGKSTSVRVCESADFSLVSCATRFDFDKPSVSMAPKSSFTPTFKAKRDEEITGIPRGLIFTSSDNEIASIDQDGLVKAGNKAGTAEIRVSDKLTGATGLLLVNTQEPVIAPVELNLNVGETKTFRLVTQLGNLMDYTDPDTYWEQSPTEYDVAVVLGATKGAWVTGRKAGTIQATVYFAALNGGTATRSASVKVAESNVPAWQGIFTIKQCSIVGSCHGPGGHGHRSFSSAYFFLADSVNRTDNAVYTWQINEGTFSSFQYKSVQFQSGITKEFSIPVRYVRSSYTQGANTYIGFDEINLINFVINRQTETILEGTFTGSNSTYDGVRANYSGTWSAIRSTLPKITNSGPDGCGFTGGAWSINGDGVAYKLIETGFVDFSGTPCMVRGQQGQRLQAYP